MVLSGRLYKLDASLPPLIWGTSPAAKFESSGLPATVDQIHNVSLVRGCGTFYGGPVASLEPIIQIV